MGLKTSAGKKGKTCFARGIFQCGPSPMMVSMLLRSQGRGQDLNRTEKAPPKGSNAGLLCRTAPGRKAVLRRNLRQGPRRSTREPNKRLAFRRPEGISSLDAARLNRLIREKRRQLDFALVRQLIIDWNTAKTITENINDLHTIHRFSILNERNLLPEMRH